jgi:hypothetical protein
MNISSLVSSQKFAAALAFVALVACSGKPDSAGSDSVSAVSAADSGATTAASQPPAVRGTVASISTSAIVIKTDTGNVSVKLAAPFQVYERAPAKLADVNDNSFIGVTTVKQANGAERATEIHIFPEELRGMGEGSRMMAQATGSSASRMTNGAVSNSRMTNGTASQSRMSNGAVSDASDSTLVVQYSGGSTTVSVPRNVEVTALKATQKTLKNGDRVIVIVKQEADGSLSSGQAMIAGR